MFSGLRLKKVLVGIIILCMVIGLPGRALLYAEGPENVLYVDGIGGAADRYATIHEAVAAAGEGDTIQLATNITLDSSTKYSLRIDKSLTIDGDGYTINGNLYLSTAGKILYLTELNINSTNVGLGGVTACIFANAADIELDLKDCNLSANGAWSSAIRGDRECSSLDINIFGGNISSTFAIYSRGADPRINIAGGAVLTGIQSSEGWGGFGIRSDSDVSTGTITAADSSISGSRSAILVPNEYVVTTTNCKITSGGSSNGGNTPPPSTAIKTGAELVAKLGGEEFAQSNYSSETDTYTVTLLKDAELTLNQLSLNILNIIIDGNGYGLLTSATNNPGIVVAGGKLTLQNITTNMEVAVTGVGAELLMNNTTINNSVLSVGGVTAAIYVSGNNAVVNVNNSSLTATGSYSTGIRIDGSGVQATVDNCEIVGAFGIYVNNTWSQSNPGNPLITVRGETEIKSYMQTRTPENHAAWGGQGIRVDGVHAVVNFEGGNIIGIDNPSGDISKSLFGIYIRGTDAEVNISGGNISGVLDSIRNEDGTTRAFGGSAVLFEGERAICNITGGTLSGVFGIDIRGGGPEINISGTADIRGISQIDPILGVWGGSGINVWSGNNTNATISGGAISGDYGIYIQGDHSNLNVSDGDIVGTQRTINDIARGGYGIYIFGSDTTSNISGGNISGTNAGVLIESRYTATAAVNKSELLAMTESSESLKESFIVLDTIELPSSVTKITGSPEMNDLGVCLGKTDGVIFLGEAETEVTKSDIPMPTAVMVNGSLTLPDLESERTVRYCLGNAFDLDKSVIYTEPVPFNEDSVVAMAVTQNVNGYKVSSFFTAAIVIDTTGDVNSDDKVNTEDLVIMALSFGSTSQNLDGKWDERADLNKDGRVDLIDLSSLASNYDQRNSIVRME